MRWTRPLTGTCLFLLCVTAVLMGQQRGGGARGGPVPAAPGAQGNRGGAGRGAAAPTNFPAQQRPAGDPALVARGNTLYGIHCRSCHGADLRGGEQGGINLLRSQLVLNDQTGELIFPVVRDGLNNPGMSPDAGGSGIAGRSQGYRRIHSQRGGNGATSGRSPSRSTLTLNVLVGDAAAGKTYFAAKCSSCHSATGDLNGIGGRIVDPMQTSEFLACRRWGTRRQRDSGNSDGQSSKRSEGRRPAQSHR